MKPLRGGFTATHRILGRLFAIWREKSSSPRESSRVARNMPDDRAAVIGAGWPLLHGISHKQPSLGHK
jgi:hypothetical protein